MLMEIHTIESICLNYGPVVFYRRGEVFRRGGGRITWFSGGKDGDQSSPTEYKEEY